MIRNQVIYHPFGESRLSVPLEKITTVFEKDGTEISYYETRIIWSKYSCLLHDFTLPANIKQAIICNVDNVSYLAVLYESGLTLFSETGESHLIPLPFPISKIYALHKAILLFRDINFGFSHPQLEDFPIMFTLFHPLEEIRPVALSSHSASIAQCPNSPMPRFTAISSPKKMNIEFQKEQSFEDKELFFITDDSFKPISLSDDHCFLLAEANKILSIWKFSEMKGSRDLLFSSPYFVRSPSIFSPPAVGKSLLSPGTVARAEVKATLEGIPPDLFMDQIFEFDLDFDNNCKIIELQDESKHYILVWIGLTKTVVVVDITYIDSNRIVGKIENIRNICKYNKLQFFTINEEGKINLYEEERIIADITPSLSNVLQISKFGSKIIAQFADHHYETFKFSITFNKVISKILEVAHMCLQPPELYSNLILTLSQERYLDSVDKFIPNFFMLLISLKDDDGTGITLSVLQEFFHLSHLLYEDLSAMKSTYPDSITLLHLLFPLASFLHQKDHLLQYTLDCPDFNINNSILIDYRLPDMSGPFESNDVWDFKSWSGECTCGNAMIDFPSVFELSKQLNGIFSEMGRGGDSRKIVEKTERMKLRKWQIEDLQPYLSLPLKECFSEMAENPPEDWPVAAYHLIGREDLASLKYYVSHKYEKISSNAYNHTPEMRMLRYEMPDLRHLEVERLLQSHCPVTVDVERPNGTDDIKFQAMNIDKLKQILQKQWSLSTGRAFFEFHTKIPSSSDKLVSPSLNEKGYTTASIELNVGNQMSSEAKNWGNFHRGFAAALTIIDAEQNWIEEVISPNNYQDLISADPKATETNPKTNNEILSFTGGAVFGFGVTGLLRKLWKSEVFEYLNQEFEQETTAIGTILGFGVAYRGTHDVGISHMISNRLAEISGDINDNEEIAGSVKASIILALGLILEGSCQRHPSEVFISMLQGLAKEDQCRGAIGTSLGAAIGLINLGQGDRSRVLLENRERLCDLMYGNGGEMISTEATNSFGNLDFFVTCPAATLALILGYFETNNERVKQALTLPEDPGFINKMHPDVVMMRVIGLILIDSSIKSAENLNIPDGLLPDIYVSYITGFAIAAGIKFAGTMNEKITQRLMKIAKGLSLLEKEPFDFNAATPIKRELSLALVLLGISFIKAGTNDIELLKFLRYVRRRNITTSFPEYIHGFHMLIGEAIGILNLGRGKFTLGNEIKDKAMMLLALYPRFSQTIEDNEMVLQTMKELIGTVIVPRVIEVHDVDTGKIVKAMIQVETKSNEVLLYQAPHVIPPLNLIKSFTIDEPDYYHLEMSNPFTDGRIRPILWIKKKEDRIVNVEGKSDPILIDRMIHQMEKNKILHMRKLNEKDKIRNEKYEIEWDKDGFKIAEYIREVDKDKRLTMLRNDSTLRSFLKYYGIAPSWKMEDIGMLTDEVLGFLIEFLTEEEASKVFLQ